MGNLWLWVGFTVAIVLLLAADLGLRQRRAQPISLREAAMWSGFWVAISLAFNLWLWRRYGRNPGLEFFTGYLIEKSLSVDNLLLFVLLFRYFAVEPRHQHRVLTWGVVAALPMRGVLIGAGVALVRKFDWMLELFGVFLVFAGLRMFLRKPDEGHPERNPLLGWARKFLPLTENYEGQNFFARRQGRRLATPLFFVLVAIEATDLVFAFDSVPAVFGITRDPFIVFSSNACAILGLRALYFLLAGLLPRFRHLRTGLSLVLLFIGTKMLGDRWVKIPTYLSLLVVAGLLVFAAAASFSASRAEFRPQAAPSARNAAARDSSED